MRNSQKKLAYCRRRNLAKAGLPPPQRRSGRPSLQRFWRTSLARHLDWIQKKTIAVGINDIAGAVSVIGREDKHHRAFQEQASQA
jgi:hypothetical protein